MSPVETMWVVLHCMLSSFLCTNRQARLLSLYSPPPPPQGIPLLALNMWISAVHSPYFVCASCYPCTCLTSSCSQALELVHQFFQDHCLLQSWTLGYQKRTMMLRKRTQRKRRMKPVNILQVTCWSSMWSVQKRSVLVCKRSGSDGLKDTSSALHFSYPRLASLGSMMVIRRSVKPTQFVFKCCSSSYVALVLPF